MPADSSEPLGRTSRPSPPDSATPEAPGASAAPAVPEVPAGVPGLTALPDDHSGELEPSPREECGVFGVWAPGEEVSRLTYFGLYALQHRGQESARGVERVPSGWSKVICEGFSPVRTRTVCHARAPSDHCVRRSRSARAASESAGAHQDSDDDHRDAQYGSPGEGLT